MSFDFDIIKVKKNPDLDTMDDEALVSLAQDEIDSYRYECDWICEKCSCTMPYCAFLSVYNEKYMHEVKCPKCKGNMILHHKNRQDFHSIYFNELFARYQDKIISESVRCANIESPDEIYSVVSGFFMKIVGKFARDDYFSKRSTKWFSAYFWRSIKNRIADIKKTNNYSKRTPSVKCPVCGKNIGQITVKHLTSKGHEIIMNTLLEDMGTQIMEESGEIAYYDTETKEFRERCNFLAGSVLDKMDRTSKTGYINSEIMKVYNKLYPGNITKNKLFSSNELMNRDDSNTEFESTYAANSVFYKENSDNDDLRQIIDEMINLHVEKDVYKLKKYFKQDTPRQRKIEIIAKIVYEKSSYTKVTDKELDGQYESEAKRGLTSAVMGLIGSKEECRNFLVSQNS